MPPAEVLVTGGTGTLRRRVVLALERGGHPVLVSSRRAPEADAHPDRRVGARPLRADLPSGVGDRVYPTRLAGSRPRAPT